MQRHETAVNEYMEGFRCSQAVLGAYAREFGLDVFSLEGRKAFAENNLKATVYTRYVGDAVKILEEILAEA
jgi:hypothetical protein